MSDHPPSAQARFEIHITSTARSYRPDDEYRILDKHRLIAHSIEEVREKICELYDDCKRVPMYLDGKDREPKQVGWIYCFNNDENIQGELHKWRQQDWVQLVKLLGEIIDPRDLRR